MNRRLLFSRLAGLPFLGLSSLTGQEAPKINKLKIMRYRGKGNDALYDLVRLRKELRDTLVVLCDRTMELADQWIAKAEAGASPPEPTSTPRRRVTSRLPPKRRASSKTGKPGSKRSTKK